VVATVQAIRRAVDAVYTGYMSGSSGPLRRLHGRLFRSPAVARWLFGTRVRNDSRLFVMDLTSVLLRSFIRPQLQRHAGLRVLELGCGHFAIPSGYLSRFTTGTFDVVDVNPDAVESTRAVVEENGFDVRVGRSDLMSSLPGSPYDLIYWNLPYYRDVELFGRLFDVAPDHLTPGGALVLGYNAVALPRQRLVELLDDRPDLIVTGVKTWHWNRHEIMVIRRRTPGTQETSSTRPISGQPGGDSGS
jgi:SAM-dependent methyltransferase